MEFKEWHIGMKPTIWAECTNDAMVQTRGVRNHDLRVLGLGHPRFCSEYTHYRDSKNRVTFSTVNGKLSALNRFRGTDDIINLNFLF